MPAAVTTRKRNAGAKGSSGGGRPSASFVSLAEPLTQPAFTVGPFQLGANLIDVTPQDVPSGGFLRYLLLEVTCAGGAKGEATPVLAADAPWNLLRYVEFLDTNGQSIYYPTTDGYTLYLHNRLGGFNYCPLPETGPDIDPTDTENPSFILMVPLELRADAWGALPNLNAAEPYRVRLGIAPAASVWTTAPDTLPTVTIRAASFDWSLPGSVDGQGGGIAALPPMMDTTQYISATVNVLVGGTNTIRLSRTGRLIRNVYMVCRNAAGARDEADYPDDVSLTLDRFQLTKERKSWRRRRMWAQFGPAQQGTPLPDGVFVYSRLEDGPLGFAPQSMLLPTSEPTSLIWEGTVGSGAAGGTLTIITNDVAVPRTRPVKK